MSLTNLAYKLNDNDEDDNDDDGDDKFSRIYSSLKFILSLLSICQRYPHM